MDLDWTPKVHSAFRVDIPHVTFTFEEAVREAWIAAYVPWINSKQTDYSVYGPYAKLAGSERFNLPFANQAANRFAELHTALLLQRKGFFCWGAVLLFDELRHVRKGKGPSVANTEKVRSSARPWRWPNEIQGTLDCLPRNPDLVAYSKKLNEWRFCEVKGPGDRVKEGQLQALAVLHLLTAAPVAVVLLKTQPAKVRDVQVNIAYKKDAQLDWIHSRLRKMCG